MRLRVCRGFQPRRSWTQLARAAEGSGSVSGRVDKPRWGSHDAAISATLIKSRRRVARAVCIGNEWDSSEMMNNPDSKRYMHSEGRSARARAVPCPARERRKRRAILEARLGVKSARQLGDVSSEDVNVLSVGLQGDALAVDQLQEEVQIAASHIAEGNGLATNLQAVREHGQRRPLATASETSSSSQTVLRECRQVAF